MKKIFTVSASSLLAILAVSCSSLEIKDETSVKMEECGFYAIADDASKTHIENSSATAATVVWDNGDALSVFSKSVPSPTNNKFTSSNVDRKSADFSGSIEEKTNSILAVYPYNSSASYSNGMVSGYSIPVDQPANNGSFVTGTSISIASASKTPDVPSCGSLSFKNLCAVLSFSLPENITFAKSITIRSKGGVKMAGAVSIDASAQSITSASSDVITLSGSFEGGSTYFVLVAPGSYSGFTFEIATGGNNTYSRETNNSFTAQAGHIYKLGKLSLNLAASDFSSRVEISHIVNNGTLEGSKALFSLTPKSEFAPLIKHYKATVSLKRGSKICRALSYDSDSKPSSAEMATVNSQYYLSSGDYIYIATIEYTVFNGEKDVKRSVSLEGSASSGSPSGLSINLYLQGYTSYSCYKGLDGQSASVANANNCEKSTIYGINASYKSGLSADVLNQCGSSLLTINSTLDGVKQSGNVGNQSWSVHTIGGVWQFDGASGTCTDVKNVYVTGLPFKDGGSLYSAKDFWAPFSNNAWRNDKYLELWTGGNAVSKSFVLPESVNVNVNGRFKLYSGASFKSSGMIVVGGQVIADESYRNAFSGYNEYTPSANISISNNANIYLEGYAHIGTATYACTVAQFFSVNVIYR